MKMRRTIPGLVPADPDHRVQLGWVLEQNRELVEVAAALRRENMRLRVRYEPDGVPF